MYRSNMKKEEAPIVLQHPVDEFQNGVETAYLDVAPPTFLERLTSYPLVRTGYSRLRDIYENTKESNGLLRSALERGESTVAYSWGRAADIIDRSGIKDRLQKPLEIADSSACYVLNKFEGKLPIITKSPYEIKLMVTETVDAKIEQIQSAKENTVEKVRDYGRWGKQTFSDVKQNGADKVQAVMETPVGQTINQIIGYGLTTVDAAVEKFLPEGHSNKNGSVSNGYATSNGNGYHSGNYEHMKQISSKVQRRLSAKSHDVVDAVIQTPGVSTLHNTVTFVRRTSTGIVEEQVEKGRKMMASTVGLLYVTAVDGLGKLIDLSHWTLMKVLPSFLHERVNLLLDKGVSVLEKKIHQE